jgi:hypothetical protein
VKDRMKERVDDADFICFIGTPKAKARYEEEKEKPNNLQLEVKHITAKLTHKPDCLVPLLIEGNESGDALPQHWSHHAGVDMRGGFPHPKYYEGIVGVVERVFGSEITSNTRYQKAKKLFVATRTAMLQQVWYYYVICHRFVSALWALLVDSR